MTYFGTGSVIEIENILKKDQDELLSWRDKQILQIQTSTSKDRFIELMVEFFTEAWDTYILSFKM